MLLIGVLDRYRRVREEGREKSRDMRPISIKFKVVRLVNSEKASLAMLVMGLKERSRFFRLLEFGSENCRPEKNVNLLFLAERSVIEDG